jgi:hypothetical protein
MMKKILCVVSVLVVCFGMLNSRSVASTAPAASQVSPVVAFTVGGQIVNSEGRPIPRCIVTLLSSDGQVVSTAITNPFGYYRFFEVEAGATYTVSVRAKGHRFMAQTVEVTGDDLNINFISQE